MKKFCLHPITKKRLQRFRRVRYAYWSFIALLFLYGLSLCSELLCNNRPLFVRYEGKSYFPFMKYYPEDTFAENGRKTRPDYKAINELPSFSEARSNYMVFAPIPFGPAETVSPEEVETTKHVTVSFVAQPSTAVLYLKSDLTVEKMRGFDQQVELQANDRLDKVFALSSGLRAALQPRFENRASAAFSEEVEFGGTRYHLKLAENKVRSKPRSSVRVYLNEVLLPLKPMQWLGDTWEVENDDWALLSPDLQSQIETTAQLAATETVADLTVDLAGTPYVIRFETEQVSFPFRPCKGHWLGLDNAGRDVLVLLLYGMRIAFSFGIVLVLTTMALGTLVGAVQGYYAGKVDMIGQRLIEIWQALPFLYILIMVGSVFGRSFMLLLVLYGIFNWIGISYYMRAEFFKLRNIPFVEAARCMGIRPSKIMLKHMLPNALVPLITFFPFSLVGAIGSLAALDYLGFGLPAGTPSWGELLSQAQQARYAWWLILYPSLALFVVMLLGVFVGEGIRSAFDPRQYNRIEG